MELIENRVKMDEPDDNLFKQTLLEVLQPAPEELVQTLMQQMHVMKQKCIGDTQAVDECLPVLEDDPRLMDVLVICYILNGGILLKHDMTTRNNSKESDQHDVLLDESFLLELSNWDIEEAKPTP
jgi:hypothetical protein